MYTIGQLSKECGLTTVALRHYEKLGLLQNPQRSASGYRLYEKTEIERVHLIYTLKEVGLTLAEIKHLLDAVDGAGTAKVVKESIDRYLNKLTGRIKQLQAIESELKTLSEQCDGNGSSDDCPILKGLKKSNPV